MHQTFFKHDQPSRVDRVLEKQKADAKAWRGVCMEVDQRDRRICRCCGKHSDPEAIGITVRGHRHHLVYRSAGGKHVSRNLVTLCASCHNDEHKDALRFTEDGHGYERLNADKGLYFWRRDPDGFWYLVRRESAPHVRVRD